MSSLLEAEDLVQTFKDRFKRIEQWESLGEDVLCFLRHVHLQIANEELSVKTALRDCGISDPTFSFRFRKRMGRTPRQYIEDSRLLLALYLLSRGDLSVQGLGLIVGYASYRSFARAFARRFGMPPSDAAVADRSRERCWTRIADEISDALLECIRLSTIAEVIQNRG